MIDCFGRFYDPEAPECNVCEEALRCKELCEKNPQEYYAPELNEQLQAAGVKPKPVREGSASDRVLKYLQDHPGATTSLIAKAAGISPSYAYSVLRKLKDQGVVVRDGKGWRAENSVQKLD